MKYFDKNGVEITVGCKVHCMPADEIRHVIRSRAIRGKNVGKLIVVDLDPEFRGKDLCWDVEGHEHKLEVVK